MKKSAQVYTERSRSGFTLIELMIVVAIIAVLSVIGIVVYGSVQANARDARRRADIDSISKAWEANYDPSAAGQHYPPLSGSWFASGAIPKDPSRTPANYNYNDVNTYANESQGKNNYLVCATLEGGDPNDCGATSAQKKCYCMQNQQ